MASQDDFTRPAGDLTDTVVDPASPGGGLIDFGGGEGVASAALDNVWKGDGAGGWVQGSCPAGPPSGPAGGDLSGTYPAPSVATVGGAAAAGIASHVTPAGGNPHGVTAAQAGAEPAGAVATHAGLPDPHTGYQKESEKGAANGYASLDGSAEVPDAEVSQSSVTQHEAAIDHDVLTNFAVSEHRVINDGGTSTTELWSADKIDSEISTLASGFDLKAGVDTTTYGEGDITLSGEQTLNGLLTSASRVLVVEQSTPSENGIWVTDASTWSRADDADGSPSGEVSNGNITHVLNSGSTDYKSKYLLVTADPITVGTTAQDWERHRDIDFGTTAGTATEGNDTRVPSQDENDALAGTSGTPSASNKYVTNADSRNSDARTPTGAAGGDLAGTYPNPTIGSDKVTNAKLADVATQTFKGRTTGGTGDPEDLTTAQATALLDLFTTTLKGLVPAPGASTGKFLKDDASWDTPAGGGGADLWPPFDPNVATFPNTNPAAAESRNGHPILAFDDTVAENVVYHSSMSRDYSAGNITVDIDWVSEDQTTGGVTWGVEFERNNPGGNDIDSDSFAAQQTGTSTTSGTSGIPTRTSITLSQAQADSIAAGDAFRLRVQRVVGDGGDDMSNDAQILRVVGRQ